MSLLSIVNFGPDQDYIDSQVVTVHITGNWLQESLPSIFTEYEGSWFWSRIKTIKRLTAPIYSLQSRFCSATDEESWLPEKIK